MRNDKQYKLLVARSPRTIPSRALPNQHLQIRSANRHQIIGVAIDPAKSFHKVLIFDFDLTILDGPFEIGVLRIGLEELLDHIQRCKAQRNATRVIIGMEASGTYSWHLSRELAQRFQEVYTFNPFTVAAARKQKLLLGQKTDAIDVAVIADLLLRRQGYPQRRLEPVFLALQELTYWRHYKANLVGKVKQQIADRFERAYPGLSTPLNGKGRLLAEPNRTSLTPALVNSGLTPQAMIAMPAMTLRSHLRAFRAVNARPSAQRIQTFMQEILAPEEIIGKIEIGLLQRDLRIQRVLEEEMRALEQEMVALVRETPARFLLGQLKGLSDVQVACFIGALGDPRHYPSARHMYSMAGLVPRQHQSGTSSGKRWGITKTGRRLLRTILFQIVQGVALHEPIFRDYRRRLRKRKPFRSAQVATMNKVLRTLYALMRDQQPFRRGQTALRIGPSKAPSG